MKTHLKIHIKGQVQGVGFRYNARIQAEKKRLTGFITNNHDGSVYIEAEGNLANLEKFITWCEKGSRFAKVDSVDIKKGRLKNYEKFQIIR